jgi:outer membrane protein
MIKKTLIAMIACAAVSAGAAAADFKVGVVNPGRVLSESAPAVAAQKKLQNYFKAREDELNRAVRDFRTRAQNFEKNSSVMSESERLKQRQDLAERERDISRRQRALLEERNQRANEESQIILSRANRIIQDLARKQNYDLILQEAVYVNPKIDLTNEVIRQLNSSK